MLLLHEAVGRPDILKRSGPSATCVADSPVFGVEGREACRSQRFAQVSGVDEVILRPPVATVDIQHNGVRALGAWKTHFEKLIPVRSIGYPLIRWWLWLAEDVFGGHRSLPAKVISRRDAACRVSMDRA